MPSEKGKKVVTGKVDIGKEGPKLERIWKLYIDGESSFDGLGAGLMLIIHEGREYTYALCFEFETTNNEAEYEALLSGLRIAREMEIKSLAIFTDSQLMANKIKGIFEARQPTIKQYLEKVKGNLKRGAAKIVQDYTKCQEHSTLRKKPSKDAIRSGNTWPFSDWGINIVGPQPTALRNLKFLAIAVEHSTKWVEAKPITTTNGKQAEKFIWEHVICKFEIPKAIPSKDDKQFKEEAIPTSTESLTPVSKEHNSKYKRKEGEDREVASIEEAYYRNKLRRYYDTRSSHSKFKLGDFVLLFQGNKEGHNVWERPHIISGVYERELYKITDASDYSLVQSPKGTSLQGYLLSVHYK
nr:reverse transcriptase domain-containing protein [Tanacetum cinerariifolium]